MAAYYNEIDEYAAQWLRNLIAAGHIAPGDVDTRSIEDVHPDDLRPYTQCHFFAGIGVWSLALRRAGWPDDRPVWTGSCPCQPFSAAGKGAGFDDERHLWPAFYWLIGECRPPVVIGEQVASKDADAWIDLVSVDLEALGYAVGAVAFPSAGVGAPHIRDRTYWVAHTNRRQQPRIAVVRRNECDGRDVRWPESFCEPEPRGDLRGMGYAGRSGLEGWSGEQRQQPQDSRALQHTGPGPTNGLWRDADWLFCRDGKWRPVEPGTFPLVDGAPARVGRLRAYGNAINAAAAEAFVASVMESVCS